MTRLTISCRLETDDGKEYENMFTCIPMAMPLAAILYAVEKMIRQFGRV